MFFRYEIIEEEPHQLQAQEDNKPQMDAEVRNEISNNAVIDNNFGSNHLKRSKNKQNFSKKVSFYINIFELLNIFMLYCSMGKEKGLYSIPPFIHLI